jgi:hypothetical protein
MKKILFLIGCCFFLACNKNTMPIPVAPAKPLQIVISNITTTLTIYSFSVTNQLGVKLIDIHSQTQNKTYNVDVNPGDTLKLTYFLELEGTPPTVLPVVSFVYEGVRMAGITNDAGIVSGSTTITIP